MKKIELICFGDLKFSGLKELEAHYIDRIKHFANLNIRVLKDIKIKDEKKKRTAEADAIRAQLKTSDRVIGLDERGESLSSAGFSRWLSDSLSYHSGRIVFLIGGHAGLCPTLDKSLHRKLSFSKMTFPHDLFRIILLEQLYRGFTIDKGITYHR